jgi:hypothetical protein
LKIEQQSISADNTNNQGSTKYLFEDIVRMKDVSLLALVIEIFRLNDDEDDDEVEFIQKFL